MLPILLIVASVQALNQTPVTSEQDHAYLMHQLGITQLRPGADGMNPKAPNYANTDETKANPYSAIPDALIFNDGKPVKTKKDWERRRKEIIELLDREVYGRTPGHIPGVTWSVISSENSIVGSFPTLTKHLIGHVDNRSYPAINVDIKLTLTTPAKASHKVPVMMEFGFSMPGRSTFTPPAGSPPSWQEQVLAKGWGSAILEATSIQADNGAGLRRGIIGLVNKGQPRSPEDWGALKAWAWGAGRALDYLQSDKQVDAKKVGIEGLSRYGKATIVTMAYDPRFAIAFVGSSGQGGVKIWRRNSGEQVENLAGSGEYHWMGGNYIKYGGPLHPSDLPVDANELVALCAPRPVFIGVGSPNVEGIWIDGKGTFMATFLASPVYRLLGKKGLSTTVMPPEGTPLIDGDLAFSQHHGAHTNVPNWPIFIEFASRYFGSSQS